MQTMAIKEDENETKCPKCGKLLDDA